MKEKYIRILYWVVLAAIFGCVVWQISSEEFDTVPAIEGRGTYVIHQEELIPRAGPNIMILDSGRIHLFYIDSELVNVYTTTGEFLHGIQFPDGRNGRSDMYCADGLLYVDARLSGIYVFDGTDLVCFASQAADKEGYDELEELFTGEYTHTDGEYLYTYVAENNKVIRSGNGTTEDILLLPQKSRYYDGLIALLGALVFAGCSYEEMKKGRAMPRRLK